MYMQNILGYSPLQAGARFLPTTLIIMVVAPLSGRLADRIGPRLPITAGLTLVTFSLYMFTRIGDGTAYSDLLPGFMLMGLGIALTMSPMSTAAMNAVTEAKAGIASGVLSMFRMLGGTFGVAAIGALFQGAARTRLDDLLAGTPVSAAQRSDIAHQLGTSQASPGDLSRAQAKQVAAAGHDAFIYALSHAMRLSAAVAAAGVVIGFVLIEGQVRRTRPRAREAALGAGGKAAGALDA
jgi:MFS family permease